MNTSLRGNANLVLQLLVVCHHFDKFCDHKHLEEEK